MTDAERKLWYAVRAGRLEGLGFRRQVPIGRYIVDFLCAKHKLVLELDGGQHGMDEAIRYDAERTDWLTANGYRVLRFWNVDVLTNLEGVLFAILEAAGPTAETRELATNGEDQR